MILHPTQIPQIRAATPAQKAALSQALSEKEPMYVRFALEVADSVELAPASSQEIARTALENYEYGAKEDVDGLSDVLQEMLVNLREDTERASASRLALDFMADRLQDICQIPPGWDDQA